jgi:dihydroxyacetone kinase-like predicted kinase
LATIYYGEDIDATRAEKTAQAVRERFPEAEVEVVEGGQPHYHYLLAVE